MGRVWWKRLHLDPVLAACFAALFAFPLGAALVAGGQPLDPEPEPAAAATARPAKALRPLPAFSTEPAAARQADDPARMRAAVARSLRDLLGPSRGAAVMRLATRYDVVAGAAGTYPPRPAPLEAQLDAALPRPLDAARARRANDAAALLVLAAAAADTSGLPAAALVAFALLDRARAGGQCLPQLNLAFVVAADARSSDTTVRREFLRAERLCGGDPTAAWMLGQYQSRQATDDPALARRAIATFRRLQRSPGGAVLGWSGEADTELRLGYEREDLLQPFTARVHFRRALALYRRAQRVVRDRGLDAGAARALAGLHEYGRAAAEQHRALAGDATFAPLAARQVEYLESAHRFGDAARVARRLVARHEFATGRALVAGDDYGLDPEDVDTPLSIGVDRLRPVQLNITGRGAGDALAVADLSFIPAFRDADGLTGHDRWCPAWSLARDLLLDGRPQAALAALPQPDADGIVAGGCTQDITPLAAMAELQAGHVQRATARMRDDGFDHTLADLFELQQDMWRFAGRLDRARAAARAWAARRPDDPRAADRLGEIEFLAGHHAAAARAFGRSLRLIRSTVRGWSEQEAYAMLKRGTALARAGRRDEALALLERADEVASRAQAAAPAPAAGFGDEVPAAIGAVFASYHARVQAGDVLLRAGRYAAAAEAYAAAREHEPALRDADEEVLARPEALHNNQAIAEAKLGHDRAAVAAARRALAADPQSPIFLETSGYALREAGRPAQAARAYRAAVAAEPDAYGAWNDLGVVLARAGRLDDAVRALRRAVGVRDDYAPAWFNLGVAQGRRGITHVLASQGAFGRAFGLDDGLRDREREFITEDKVVFTELDLSKPLPPRWSYAAGQERAPVAAAGIVLLVLLGLRLGRTLLARSFGGSLAGRLVDPVTSLLGRMRRVPLFLPWLVAVLATVAVFVTGLLRGGSGATDEALVLVAGVLLLTAIVGRGRRLAARAAGVGVGQRGWTPGIALGAVVAAVGSAWAPLPVAEPDGPAPAVHWIGAVLTGVAALGLLVLGAWLNTPGTIAVASVALVMTASMLTPTKPLDGGYVSAGTAGIGLGLALLAGGLFFVLGVG